MTMRKPPQISSRKKPQQSRSAELVAAILEAATQVLKKEGAQRFTTARVAERAGVSIGSVYQYFPNKTAILFRLQSDEWQQTMQRLCTILLDYSKLPQERLRALVHAFIQSECEEAQMRVALHDAAPLYRHTPEAQEIKASGARIFQGFMQELLPATPNALRIVISDLISTTLRSAGQAFSGTPRTTLEIDAYANAMADMFSVYLSNIEKDALARSPS